MADANEVLTRLYETILARKEASPEESYTAALFASGVDQVAQKFGEESVETIVAALGDDEAALVSETADVLYHLLVLLAARGVTPDQVFEELAKREGISGHEEKAGREKDK